MFTHRAGERVPPLLAALIARAVANGEPARKVLDGKSPQARAVVVYSAGTVEPRRPRRWRTS